MTTNIAPIKPGDVAVRRDDAIPPAVIEAFNTLITKNFSFESGSARVVQDDVVKLLVKNGFKRQEIFEKSWLDVEGIFRKAGWEVTYDKPAYCESYEAFFLFESKRGRPRLSF